MNIDPLDKERLDQRKLARRRIFIRRSPRNSRGIGPGAGERLGCAFCFETLSPLDPRLEKNRFQKCEGCGALYHDDCWRTTAACVQCGSPIADFASVDPPGALPDRYRPGTKFIEETPEERRRNLIIVGVGLTLAIASFLFLLVRCETGNGAGRPVETKLPPPTSVATSSQKTGWNLRKNDSD